MTIKYVENLEGAIIRVLSEQSTRANANVLAQADKLLNKLANDFCRVYGFSRHQEIVNYKNRNKIPKEIKITFWEAISDLPTESSVFRNMVLDTLRLTNEQFNSACDKQKKGKPTDFMALIAPLAVNDKSNGKHATFSKVYKRMPVDFSKLSYKGTKRNALQIPKVRKIFIKTVNEMLAELEEV